jgi:hypothetical protein
MRLASLPGAAISGGAWHLKIAGGLEVAERFGEVALRKR